ncbi:MAG TPA: AMP-binding protein [Solirubrobacteraceae bacterium]|nr:AMP-binding protein [Solirubrobacteraceae bacterium]
MRVPSWLHRAAVSDPGRPAVETPAGALTYAELDAASRIDLPAGQRVAIALPAGLDFAVALHACLRSGAPAVPVDLRLAAAEQARIRASAAVVIDEPVCGDRSPGRPAGDHDLDATAAVIHTSGTTGRPKAIELTYGNWLWSALGSATAIGLDPAERWLCTLPLAHVGGLSILIRSAIYGTTAVLHPRFDTRAVLDALMDDRITIVSLVPTTLTRLLDAGLESPPALRCALIGGAPASPALLERARAAGIVAVQTYGLTEACSQVTTQIPGEFASDAGRPLFCTRVRIHAGEIEVAGPTVARRRGADPDEDAGEWLGTGDLGELVDGRLVVTGRRSEMILTGGENVAPAEIEAVLAEHPAVREVAVVGYPHPDWGEAVRAVIVLEPGLAADDDGLRAHCAAGLAGFKVPKQFVYVDALPRTTSGKLARRELGRR